MADPTFFKVAAPVTAGEAAALTGGRLGAGVDSDRRIAGVAPLETAGPADATFFTGRRFADALAKTRAGLCFCEEATLALMPPSTVAVVVADPRSAFAALSARLYPDAVRPAPITGVAGISPLAHIDPAARLESGVTVEAGAVIGALAEIGRGTLVAPGAVIGPGVRIGRDAVIGIHASVTNTLIGDRVIIQAGARLGQDGFGFIPGTSRHLKITHIGRVIVQDDVEIGSNTTIDRGSNRDTVIGEGTKIDNLVQVAHNVVIGRHCFIAGQVGISGSVTIGDFVMIGGHAGIRDNVTIGNGAHLAAMAGIHTDVPAGARWVGAPAQPMMSFQRELRALKRLARASAGGAKGETRESSDG